MPKGGARITRTSTAARGIGLGNSGTGRRPVLSKCTLVGACLLTERDQNVSSAPRHHLLLEVVEAVQAYLGGRSWGGVGCCALAFGVA